MSAVNSASGRSSITLPPNPAADPAPTSTVPRSAIGWGLVGIVGFSFTLPMTREAVHDLDPLVVGLGRAVVAGVLAAIVLLVTRRPLPHGRDWLRLAGVALGVVVGFPLLTSVALHHAAAAHTAVIVGLIPAATAVWAVVRGGERPSRAFWLAAGCGLVAVLTFAVAAGGGTLGADDLYTLAAVVLCSYGYAEGGALARRMGGWPVICWALVLSLPLLSLIVGLRIAAVGLHAGTTAWLGFSYVSVVSMFLAFFAWYAGLARGGIARIGQVQLIQPPLGLGWAALLLGERITLGMVFAALAVLVCVVATQRAR